MSDKYETRARLIVAVLDHLSHDVAGTYRNPGPWDDAEAELGEDRLLHSAREYVAAHTDVTTLPG